MTSYVDAIFVKPNVLALQMKNPKKITARQSNHSNYKFKNFKLHIHQAESIVTWYAQQMTQYQ